MQRPSGAGKGENGDNRGEVMEMTNYPYQYQQPWIGYQQRPQQQWYQPAQPQPMQNPQPVQAVMVTSKAEADAAQIPFDPAVVSVYVDLAHGAVYTKRFNPQTGGADVETYARVTDTPAQEAAPDPVSEQISDLMRRVEALEAKKSGKKEAAE